MARDRVDTAENTLAPVHFFIATDPWTYEPRRHNPTLDKHGEPKTGPCASDLEFWCEFAGPRTTQEGDGTPIHTGEYFDLAGRKIIEPHILLYLNPSAGYSTLQEAEEVARERVCPEFRIPYEQVVFLMRPATEIEPHTRFSSFLDQWRVARGKKHDDRDDAQFFALFSRNP